MPDFRVGDRVRVTGSATSEHAKVMQLTGTLVEVESDWFKLWPDAGLRFRGSRLWFDWCDTTVEKI